MMAALKSLERLTGRAPPPPARREPSPAQTSDEASLLERAVQHKETGNGKFASGDYKGALEEYMQCISLTYPHVKSNEDVKAVITAAFANRYTGERKREKERQRQRERGDQKKRARERERGT
jgi:hypothetical protein